MHHQQQNFTPNMHLHHDNTPMKWAVISGNPIIEAIGRLTEKRLDVGREDFALQELRRLKIRWKLNAKILAFVSALEEALS